MKYFLRKIQKDIPVLLFYTAVTILFTYPWVLNFTTHKLGDDIDGSMLVWNLWWVAKSLFSSGESVFFTNYIFYPIGTSLVFHTLTIVNGIFAFVVSPLVDTLVTFNVLTLLTFILSGYGAFLLAEYLVEDRWAALIGGFIYAFSPFRMLKVSFINYLSMQWLPLYFFFLLKILNDRELKKRNLLFCSVFLLFNALSCEIYGFYAALYTIPLLFFYSVSKKENLFKRNLLRLGAVFILFIAMFFPALYRMLQFIMTEGSSILSSTLENAEFESVDLLAYFIPNPIHPLWGDNAASMMSSFSGIFQETVVFPGFITILIIVSLTPYCIKKKEILFYYVLLLFSVLMTLGPYLHVGGKSSFLGGSFKIPMPYMLSYYLPFFSAVRIPGRYGVMVMLFISVLAGFCVKYFYQKINRKALTLMVLFLLMLEFWTLPFPFISDMRVPSVYRQIKDDNGDFSILHFPLGWRAKGTYHLGYNFTRFQYYQTYHGKRIFDGMLARTSQYNTDYFARMPIISSLVKIEYGEMPDEKEFARDIAFAEEFIGFFDVRYIVLDEVYERVFTHLTPKQFKQLDSYINIIFRLQPVYLKSDIEKFEIRGAFDRYAEYLKFKNPPRQDPYYSVITSLDTTYKVYRVGKSLLNDFNLNLTPDSENRYFYMAGSWLDVDHDGKNFFSLPAGSTGILFSRFPNIKDKVLTLGGIPSNVPDVLSKLKVKINGTYPLNVQKNIQDKSAVDILIPGRIQKNGINRIEITFEDTEYQGKVLFNKIFTGLAR